MLLVIRGIITIGDIIPGHLTTADIAIIITTAITTMETDTGITNTMEILTTIGMTGYLILMENIMGPGITEVP